MKPLPLTPQILEIARGLIWFEPPEQALSDPVRFGDEAGRLLPIREVLAHGLPTMTRFRVYDDPPRRLSDLLGNR